MADIGGGFTGLSAARELAERRPAMGDRSELLNVALSLEKPGLLPPESFLRLGVSWRVALDRMKAAAEL